MNPMILDTAKPPSTRTRGRTQIWPEDPVVESNSITYGAKIEFPDGTSDRLFHTIPLKFANYVSDSCDSFLLALLLRAAEYRADLHIHGQISPSLLKNLVEFQDAFRSWYPKSFNKIEITADKEAEDEFVGNANRGAICALSGGFDSGFTIYRHKLDPNRGRFSKNIEAGLLVQGIDIPLSANGDFEALAAQYEPLAQRIGLELITIKSNTREVNRDWMITQGLAMASFFTLFKKRFSEGLLSSSDDYNHLVVPWGSNPITDHLLSSNSFAIVHDGSGFTRSEKIAAVANWKELYDHIRVCFMNSDYTKNCGRCYKCTVAWLCVKIAGSPHPASLPVPTPDDVLKIRNTTMQSVQRLRRVFESPRWNEIPLPMRKAIRRCYNFNTRQRILEQPCDRFKAARLFLSKVHRHIGIYIS